MKALFTLRNSIDPKPAVATATLISLVFWMFPATSLAAELSAQTPEKRTDALVFEIKNPELVEKISNPNRNLLSFAEITANDPLVKKLQAYLEQRKSPLAQYAAEIVQQPQWKRSLSISFVESNFGRYCANNNCSGIGVAPGNASWRKYDTKLDWFKDMCALMETPRYKEKYTTYKSMKGVYVYPGSASWVYGAEKVDAELTQIEQEAAQDRISLMQQNHELAYAYISEPSLSILSQ